MSVPELRPATEADATDVARIWREGWRDGHLGHTPDALVEARTDASFDDRAVERLPLTTVATVDGAIVGFTVVDGDEAEQRQVAAAGHSRIWLAVASGNARARRFYERSGWSDAGAFDYQADGPDGPIAVPCHRYVRDL